MTLRSLPLTAWTYPLLALGLCPVVALLKWLLDWEGGSLALAVLIVPTCLAAFSAPRSVAVATAIVGSLGCLADAWLAPPQPEAVNWGFAMLSIGLLFGISGMIANVTDPIRPGEAARPLPAQDFLRDLTRRDQEAHDLVSAQLARFPAASLAVSGEEAAFNYPLLLVALQDASRRIASQLEGETLVPAIASTVRQLLKCEQCDVFLWDAAAGSMENAHPRQMPRCLPPRDHAVMRRVLEQRQLLSRADLQRDAALRAVLEQEPRFPDLIAPLVVSETVIGLLVIHGVDPNPATVRAADMLSILAALALHAARFKRQVDDFAQIDPLTGVLNHARLQEACARLTRSALQSAQPLTAVLCDLDHFQELNETYGYEAGDKALRELARLCRRALPEQGVVGRYGSDQFVCLLPGCDGRFGQNLAEALRTQLAAVSLQHEGQRLPMTACFGVSELGRPARSAADLLHQARQALRQARREGRNRVQTVSVPAAAPRRLSADPLEALSDTVVMSRMEQPLR